LKLLNIKHISENLSLFFLKNFYFLKNNDIVYLNFFYKILNNKQFYENPKTLPVLENRKRKVFFFFKKKKSFKTRFFFYKIKKIQKLSLNSLIQNSLYKQQKKLTKNNVILICSYLPAYT
jgi:hypothetical protein